MGRIWEEFQQRRSRSDLSLHECGVFLAAQCCEHLNRAVIIEHGALLPGTEICNVVPRLHAGGAFGMTIYINATHPIAVEEIRAVVGMDIGDTLIEMHLRKVAVPIRISIKKIGEANLVCARTRPKFIGGMRAEYDESLIGGEIRRDRGQSNMERIGSIEKVYEAYSTIADDRGSISDSEHLLTVESSDKRKSYTVT